MKQYTILGILLCLTLAVGFASVAPARAAAPLQDGPWCGSMSESENWGFNFSKDDNYHWTVNGNQFVSQATIDQVDVVLDGLNNDNIAQTMVLMLRSEDVSVGPNCAGMFREYMTLGNEDGPRADNGFAWLMVYDKTANTVTAYYAVGGSLNSLHTSWLQEMKRQITDKYSETQSLDATMLFLVSEFDAYARQQYEPYHEPVSTQAPQPVSGMSLFGLLCMVVIGIIVLFVVLWFLAKAGLLSSSGTTTTTYHHNTYPTHTTHTPTPRSQPVRRTGSGSNKGTRVG